MLREHRRGSQQMDNPDKLATLDKQSKKHTTIYKQTQTTQIRHEPSCKHWSERRTEHHNKT